MDIMEGIVKIVGIIAFVIIVVLPILVHIASPKPRGNNGP